MKPDPYGVGCIHDAQSLMMQPETHGVGCMYDAQRHESTPPPQHPRRPRARPSLGRDGHNDEELRRFALELSGRGVRVDCAVAAAERRKKH
eukprot:1037039-Rhodomonas_salina.1